MNPETIQIIAIIHDRGSLKSKYTDKPTADRIPKVGMIGKNGVLKE